MDLRVLADSLSKQAEECSAQLERYRIPGSTFFSDHDGSVERLSEARRVLDIVATAIRRAADSALPPQE